MRILDILGGVAITLAVLAWLSVEFLRKRKG